MQGYDVTCLKQGAHLFHPLNAKGREALLGYIRIKRFYCDVKRLQQRYQVASYGPESQKAHPPFEEAVRPGHPPAIVATVMQFLLNGANTPQTSENHHQRGLSYRPTDRGTPIGHQHALFKQLARNDTTHASGDVADVLELTSLSQIDRQHRRAPAGQQYLGLIQLRQIIRVIRLSRWRLRYGPIFNQAAQLIQ